MKHKLPAALRLIVLLLATPLLVACTVNGARDRYDDLSLPQKSSARHNLVSLVSLFLEDGTGPPAHKVPSGSKRLVLAPELTDSPVNLYVYWRHADLPLPEPGSMIPVDAYLVAKVDAAAAERHARLLPFSEGICLSETPDDRTLSALRHCKPRFLALNNLTVTTALSDLISGFGSLEALVIYGVEMESLAHASFKNLSLLDLRAVTPEPSILKLVQASPGLQTVAIRNCPLGSETLFALRARKKLRDLDLSNSALSDEQLIPLLGTLRLSRLSIHKTDVSDKAAPAIARQIDLQYLNASRCNLTDAALRTLVELPRLDDLNLDNTSVTDAGVKILSKSPTLRNLGLKGTKCTPACLQYLRSMPALQILSVPDTFTDGDLAAAKTYLPHCQIQR